MRCPFCSSDDIQVKDSRPAEDNSSIRRRRACAGCGARFTTFERVQLRDMVVLKADNKSQAFDRDKLIRSMRLALQKRPVDMDEIERMANAIVRQLESLGEPEIKSKQIGELVMKALARMDTVGYIRYASVYKDFSDQKDFNEFLEELDFLQADDKSEVA
jgi:transcriptional repressor NrdR